MKHLFISLLACGSIILTTPLVAVNDNDKKAIETPRTPLQSTSEIDESSIKPRVFDAIISLGFNCHCATQLRYLGLRQFNYFFDWIISKSAAQVASAILNDFEGLLERNNFSFITSTKITIRDSQVVDVDKRSYISDERYLFRFTHDFPITEDYQTSWEMIKAKFERRFKRFITTITNAQTSRKPVLFIRENASPTDALLLQYAITQRYPSLDFVLLIINDTEKSTIKWNIPHVIHRLTDNTDWKIILSAIIDFPHSVVPQPTTEVSYDPAHHDNESSNW